MEPVQAILFDMDGVVIDTRADVDRGWYEVAEQYGVTLRPEDFDQHVYGCKADHTLRALFPMIPESDWEDVLRPMISREISAVYAAVPGVVSLLQTLHAQRVKTALVTSGEWFKVDPVCTQLGLHGLFDAAITGEDVTNGKPDPDCYLRAAAALGVEPGVCLVFEDAISGVTAATRAGMHCVGIGQRAEHLVAAGAATVIADFTAARLVSQIGRASCRERV
jgi:HAD superfamily hydrolase (TIGR01509 family)